MLELEKTYLAKYLPEDLMTCRKKEIVDIYLPKDSPHPKLRLRKSWSWYEITKKKFRFDQKWMKISQYRE